MNKTYIRQAFSDDADAIAQLSIQTFRDTFATDSNTTDIETYLEKAFSLQQISAEIADSKNTFLLSYLKESKGLVGYAKLRLGQRESCIAAVRPIEIGRLYVTKAAIGQGVGKQLMQTCLERAAAEDCDVAWLGVWEHNTRAIQFYKKWNFTVVGSHVFKLGSEDQNDLIMQRPIT